MRWRQTADAPVAEGGTCRIKLTHKTLNPLSQRGDCAVTAAHGNALRGGERQNRFLLRLWRVGAEMPGGRGAQTGSVGLLQRDASICTVAVLLAALVQACPHLDVCVDPCTVATVHETVLAAVQLDLRPH